MYAYIARQPIFDRNKQVHGYELLYRDGKSGNAANISDGDQATRYLLSDAIMLFGLPQLTNGHPAYVNFTENLIRTDFVYLAKPKDIIVELLEDIQVDDALVEKLKALKKAGYTLAMDDYNGHPRFDPLLPLVDVVKVDFRQATPERQQGLAEKFKKTRVHLLAEKVETVEEFDAARDMGYALFQGYFFEKPKILNKKFPSVAATTCGRMIVELQRKTVDFNACAWIVHSDAYMTYMLLQRVRTLHFYRGNLISGIKNSLVMLGEEELRRWTLLLMARQYNVTYTEELPRQAYLRALFLERLMQSTPKAPRGEQGFLLGMFSLMDKILGMPMADVLKDIPLEPALKAALLGREDNQFSKFLQFAIMYEKADLNLILPEIGLPIDGDQVARLYMECMGDADRTFSGETREGGR